MRISWFLPIITLVAFTACNNGDSTPDTEKPEGTIRNYLSVNILSPVAGFRDGNEVYEPGTPEENKINAVRFYFFDDEGNATPVRKQGATDNYLSYIDWIPTDADIDKSENPGQSAEKILTATLGINMPAATTDLPGLILAILNPPQDILSMTENPSLESIEKMVNDYKSGYISSNFVITNSVYSENSKLINATHLTDDNFQSTEEEAKENAVKIYVERVLARLDLSIALEPKETANGTIYLLGTEDDKYSIDGQNAVPMYVKLLGWNITSYTTKSRLIKSINGEWAENIFGDEPWNIAQLHRSFWAINPQGVECEYGPFTSEKDKPANPKAADALKFPAADAVTSIYLQENANPYSPSLAAEPPAEATKIILAGQLVNETGVAQNLVRWANRYYTEEGAKNAITNSLNLYRITTEDGATVYTPIKPADLEFVSVYDLYPKEDYPEGFPDDVANYYSYVQLTEDAEGYTWYNGNTQSSPALTTKEANDYILNLINYVMFWNQGYTYYYLDIRHIGDEGSVGYAGVVRNHVYKAIINSIKGLGTPVYERDEVIYPEKPGYDDSVLSAVINILPWRVVTQEYNFNWE